MAYVALYRKWRPTGFSELVGQAHVSRTFAQAIASGRVGHAYLFSGPRGTGKTSTAKILAKALNCAEGPTAEPCNVCESCRRVNDGTSMDVLEIDAASNRGIDEIRGLRETVKFAPAAGRYKVYIIDEVHMLTSEAFNALLKTLEEPPPAVVFILATTEPHKVPATIQSRCQRYDFRRIAAREIEARLREVTEQSGIAADADALALIACEADGGMRDALSTLDQCASLAETRVTEALVREILGLVGRESVMRILRALSARDAREALAAVEEVIAGGKDAKQLVSELVARLRAAMVRQAAGALPGAAADEADEAALGEAASLFSPEAFLPMIRRLHEALAELRWTSEPRVAVEAALLAICRDEAGGGARSEAPAARAAGVDEARLLQLAARVETLERALAAAGAPSASAAAPALSAPPDAPTVEKAKAPVQVLRAGDADAIGTIPPARVRAKDGAKARKNDAPKENARRETAGGADGPVFVKTAEGEALWTKLLATLADDPKRKVVHACVSTASFGGMTETQFCVTLKSAFLVKRIERADYRAAIEERAEELNAAGKEELADIIAGRTAAYISDKADALGLAVTVRVETEPGEDGVPIPYSAELAGSYSRDLADWMALELGIPAERQVWHDGKN